MNYQDLIAPLIKAVQALSSQLSSIENALADFADSFTTKELVAKNITTDAIQFQTASGQKLCLGSTCVTESQLQAMLTAANQSSASANTSPTTSNTNITPPVIVLDGSNPAIIVVGGSYSDLGATITGPQADLNLGIKTFLNGTLASNIVIDTSAVATDTIDYVVTDQNGLTATSTRTVIIDAATSSPSGQ